MFAPIRFVFLSSHNVAVEQPRLSNKIVVKNKINKEPKSNQIAQDRGVGSTDSLSI